MKVFKIPKVSDKTSVNTIIGIIDASGSMEGHWPWVAKHWNEYIPAENAITITFDTTTRECKSNRLSSKIGDHGGGGTNITLAFEALEKKLKDLPKDSAVTVIFISDGQDNNLNTLETRCKKLAGNAQGLYINFLCLGVESGFPTFLSMKLREKYHTGDTTIPAVFLIEYSSEKAFFNKFESMKPYFVSASTVNIEPPVIQYPWAEAKNEIYENIWVITDSSMLDIEGNIIDLSRDAINLEGVVEIFKGWVQTIQLESLKPGVDVKKMATATLKYMNLLVDQVKKEKGIDILKLDKPDDSEDITFAKRALKNFIKHSLGRAAWFYEEINLLSQGKSVKEMGEYDAAKKIGLATIVGKYQQKALALKGITPDEFKKIRNEFASLLKDAKLEEPKMTAKGESHQRSVFSEPDFLEGLEMCNNQYDLIESFPFIGIGIRLKRYNGSQQNPWLTEVKYILKNKKNVNTIEIIDAKENLDVKDGDTTQSVNAVLPLYQKEDEDLKTLLGSRFLHLLMTFNVQQDLDSCYDDGYLALLSSALLYTLREGESDWRKEILGSIVSTAKLVYADNKEFHTYRENLIQKPHETIANDNEQKRYGSVDPSKALIHLYLLWAEQLVNEQKAKEIFDAILSFYVYNIVKQADFQITTFLKCKLVSTDSVKAIESIRANFSKVFTLGDLRRQVYSSFENLMQDGANYEYNWDISDINRNQTKLCKENFDDIAKILFGKVPEKEDWVINIGRAYISGNFEATYSKDTLSKTEKDVTGIIAHKINESSKKGKNKNNIKVMPAVVTAVAQMTKEFQAWFKEIHYEILPLKPSELKKYCEDNKVQLKNYSVLADSGLIRNACLAPKCPFYMKTMDRVHHHIACWEDNLPLAFHRTVKSNYKAEPKKIYELFLAGSGIKRNIKNGEKPDPTKERSEDEILQYICKLKAVYEDFN